jgi:hypothetical protein
MSDNKSLFDAMVADDLSDASKEEKFAAKLGTVSDLEFDRIASYLCSRGDAAKRAAAAAPPPEEQTDIEQAISEMSDEDLADMTPDDPGRSQSRLRSSTLSNAMAAYRKGRGLE